MKRDAFKTNGSSPPANYTVIAVTFRLARQKDAGPGTLLSSPEAVTALARQLIADDAREHFGIFMLNTQNRLIAYHEVSVGTLSAALVHPREVFGPALRLMGVASLILVHNHPSADPTPSREDLRLTWQLVDAGKLLELEIHDHVIIGNGSERFVSLAHTGQLAR
jgi:DNA repair protein RadC